jgi:hypothetical protein
MYCKICILCTSAHKSCIKDDKIDKLICPREFEDGTLK